MNASHPHRRWIACAVALVLVAFHANAAFGQAGEIGFALPESDVAENAGQANITVQRTGGSAGEASVRVSVTDITTTPDDYFAPAPGMLDPSFVPAYDAGHARIAVQADGRVVYALDDQVGRFNADGSADATFNAPPINDDVLAIAVQSDGKILIGGEFTQVGGATLNHIARLEANGSLDTTFDPGTGANNVVNAIGLQSDGKIIIGGGFTSVDDEIRARVARLNSDGSFDGSFGVAGNGANNTVRDLVVLPDDKVVIAGGFSSVLGQTRLYVARLHADGTVDLDFDPGTSTGTGATSSLVRTVSVHSDGKVVLGGQFNNIGRNAFADYNYIVRFNDDGTHDASFDPPSGPSGSVYSVVAQPDGKIVVGGNFLQINGQFRRYFARFNADGTLDTGFNTAMGFDGEVEVVVQQADGKFVVSGDFFNIQGTEQRPLARLGGDWIVSWADGDDDDKTITLPIVDNAIPEPDRQLELSLTMHSGAASLGSISSHVLTILDDDQVPAITDVTSGIANGTYGPDSIIDIDVVFTNRVHVTGEPTLELNSGGTATYHAGSGSNELTFRYIVGAEDEADPLDYVATTALELNGATIEGEFFTADLTLPAPQATGSLGSNKNIRIDPSAPAGGGGDDDDGGCHTGSATSLNLSLLITLALCLLVARRRLA